MTVKWKITCAWDIRAGPTSTCYLAPTSSRPQKEATEGSLPATFIPLCLLPGQFLLTARPFLRGVRALKANPDHTAPGPQQSCTPPPHGGPGTSTALFIVTSNSRQQGLCRWLAPSVTDPVSSKWCLGAPGDVCPSRVMDCAQQHPHFPPPMWWLGELGPCAGCPGLRERLEPFSSPIGVIYLLPDTGYSLSGLLGSPAAGPE